MNSVVKEQVRVTPPAPKRRKKKVTLFDVFVTVFCLLFAVICFFPIWYVIVVSLTPYKDFVSNPVAILPPWPLDFSYYQAIFSTTVFRTSMLLSVFKTIGGTLLSLMVTAMMAYGVSKEQAPGMKVVNLLVIITMYFGGGLIPTYLLYRDIGILKTIWPMVLPMAMNVGYFVIMRNYFMYSVPKGLEEAAMLDGANQIQIFFRIVLPTSSAMIAAVALFIAVYHWNDWYNFMMYVNVNKLQPYSWMLRRVLVDPSFVNNMASDAQNALGGAKPPPMQLRMSTIVVATLPIMCVYPFLQKYFAQGMMLGAVKE